MDAQRRYELDGRLLDASRLALDLELRPALAHVEQLSEIGVPVRLDLPVVQTTAGGDRLAVQQVRGRPFEGSAVELEHRDVADGIRHRALRAKWPIAEQTL